MEQVREQIRRLAASRVAVLILGETGSGKELAAEAIALLSGCQPFVPVNCAAIADSLVESELFGHERGAFTGAIQSRVGLVEEANGGTLFLDELAEIPIPVQAKLLRTLDSGEYRRVGSNVTRQSDFRILAATSGDVDGSIAAGRLREDLMHRVGAARIWMPALHQRLTDIPLLAEGFLCRYRERCHSGPLRITQEACALLMQQEWPGNVRQLRNVVEVAAAWARTDSEIGVQHVLEVISQATNGKSRARPIRTLAEARDQSERQAILEALHAARGNRQGAAKLLGISEATLYRKLGNHRGPPAIRRGKYGTHG
jgi:DNA-binding NtrC family response regulator